jgi:hypothetical protein
VKLQTFNRYASIQKEIHHDQDTITIRYIPLPPKKRKAWERSMRILAEMMIEILKEEAIMNNWINAERVKPLDNTEVLGVIREDGLVFHEIVVWDSRDGGEWTKASNEEATCDVLFWVELPPLPKSVKA